MGWNRLWKKASSNESTTYSTARGNFKAAYDWHQKYSALKDRTFNQENSDRLNRLNTAYEAAQREIAEHFAGLDLPKLGYEVTEHASTEAATHYVLSKR